MGPERAGRGNFVSSRIEQDAPKRVLEQYSFFGDLAGADDALESGLEAPPAELQPHSGRPEGSLQLDDMPVSSQWLPHRSGDSPERPHSAHANSSDAASHAALPVSTNFSAAALYQDTAFATADAPPGFAYGMPDALPPAPYGRPAPIHSGGPGGAHAFGRTVSADATHVPADPYGSSRSQAQQYEPMLPVSGMPRRLPQKAPSHGTVVPPGPPPGLMPHGAAHHTPHAHESRHRSRWSLDSSHAFASVIGGGGDLFGPPPPALPPRHLPPSGPPPPGPPPQQHQHSQSGPPGLHMPGGGYRHSSASPTPPMHPPPVSVPSGMRMRSAESPRLMSSYSGGYSGGEHLIDGRTSSGHAPPPPPRPPGAFAYGPPDGRPPPLGPPPPPPPPPHATYRSPSPGPPASPSYRGAPSPRHPPPPPFQNRAYAAPSPRAASDPHQPPRPPHRPFSQSSPRGPSPRGRAAPPARATSRGASPSLPNIPGLDFWVHDHACMSARELEDLLAFNMRNTHVSEIYIDDYYYEAFINKYFGAFNTRRFRPSKLFALAPHERGSSEEAAHAKVDGLGKFVYASLRTPRQLLAVDGRPPRRKAAQRSPFPETVAEVLNETRDGAGKPASRASSGPAAPAAAPPAAAADGRCTLHTDRQVAARKVIEDCNCQLLDVDDADRAIAAQRAAAQDGEHVSERDTAYYLERRCLLMDNIADALRIGAGGGGAAAGDEGVFRFIVGTNKGRALAARALERVGTFGGRGGGALGGGARVHGLGMLLGTLRAARALFGDNVAPPPSHTLVTSEDMIHVRNAVDVAAAAAAALARLHRPEDVLRCFEALTEADIIAEVPEGWEREPEQLGTRGLLPLLLLQHTYQSDEDAAWLGTVLTALFDAAARARVHAGATAEAFRAAFEQVFDRIMVHLMALIGLLERARATGVQEAIDSVRGLAASAVLHAMLQVCTPQQEEKLILPLSVIVGASGDGGVA